MYKVVLLRHGESAWNKENRFTGWTDVDLTDSEWDDVKDDVAYIELGGGCVGCGMVNVTLKQGIEVMIMQAVPQIKAVVDTTDHASGTNPYYAPAKGGQAPQSPLA